MLSTCQVWLLSHIATSPMLEQNVWYDFKKAILSLFSLILTLFVCFCSLQEEIKLFVNRLNSEESVIPYEYEQ
jgi:hypothetical protein